MMMCDKCKELDGKIERYRRQGMSRLLLNYVGPTLLE